MIASDKIKRIRRALASRGTELSAVEVAMFYAPLPTDPVGIAAYDKLNIKIGEAIGLGEFGPGELGPKMFLPLEAFCREVSDYA